MCVGMKLPGCAIVSVTMEEVSGRDIVLGVYFYQLLGCVTI